MIEQAMRMSNAYARHNTWNEGSPLIEAYLGPYAYAVV